jgi:hypothetical protein
MSPQCWSADTFVQCTQWCGTTLLSVAGEFRCRFSFSRMTVMRLHLVLLCAALVTAQCNNHGVPDGRICKCDDAFLPPFCQTEATRLVLESSWPYELRWAVHPEQGTIDMAIMFGGHSCWAGLGSLFKFSLLQNALLIGSIRITADFRSVHGCIRLYCGSGSERHVLSRLGCNCVFCLLAR